MGLVAVTEVHDLVEVDGGERGEDECLQDGDDAVFLPSDDGGYVLVGLRAPQPSLFEAMRWSTERVMKDTRRRLEQARLRWREPATLWDVDTPADLARLRAAGLMAVS